MTPLAVTLRTLREQRGMTQRALVERAGVTRGTLQNLEQSRVARPHRHVVDALADALGVTPDEITTDVFDPERPTQRRPEDIPPAPVSLSIGPRLRTWRETRGYSQETLAVRAGLSRQGIQKMEGGSRNVKPSTVRQLAEALGVTVYDLAPDFDTPPVSVAPEPAAPAPLDPALVALAATVEAYDPGAVVVVDNDGPAVAAMLSNDAILWLRDDEDWAAYLRRVTLVSTGSKPLDIAVPNN